jgi:hypothetical protein
VPAASQRGRGDAPVFPIPRRVHKHLHALDAREQKTNKSRGQQNNMDGMVSEGAHSAPLAGAYTRPRFIST